MTNGMGFFGKLPGYGDFIERNLPRTFIDQWDQWLQQAMAVSRQMLGEHWLDSYLTAPVWRFALSSGCVDNQGWMGVLLPSVDRVGRYFPLTLAMPVSSNVALTAALGLNDKWFKKLENIALACLNESPTVEAVVEVLAGLELPLLHPIRLSSAAAPAVGQAVSFRSPGDMTDSANDMSETQNLIFTEALLRNQHPSFSLWYSVGNEAAPDVQLACEALPNPRGVAGLLTGQWQSYGWNIAC